MPEAFGPGLFDALWTIHRPDYGEQEAFWNRRSESYNARGEEDEAREHRRLLIGRLAARAGLDGDSLVLDIGCGPGRQTLSLAALAGRAEGLDLAPRMIELARLNAAEAGLTNVDFRTLDWTTADLRRLGWEKKFHLVMAAKTPAVNDRAALEKMTAASRGFCCLITQADVSHSIRDRLKTLLDWDEAKARAAHSLYCAFNLLWLAGYYPEVEYIDRDWESDSSLEEAESMYVRYFESLAPLTPETRKALTDELAALSRGGLVREKVKSRAIVLFWAA